MVFVGRDVTECLCRVPVCRCARVCVRLPSKIKEKDLEVQRTQSQRSEGNSKDKVTSTVLLHVFVCLSEINVTHDCVRLMVVTE